MIFKRRRKQVYCLIYASNAARAMHNQDLIDLLMECREANGPLGITGALLYQDGNFMQALEGDQETVDNLYQRIARDPRHVDVTLLATYYTPRQFPDWSMAFGNFSTGVAVGFGLQGRSLAANDGEQAHELLRLFRETLGGTNAYA